MPTVTDVVVDDTDSQQVALTQAVDDISVSNEQDTIPPIYSIRPVDGATCMITIETEGDTKLPGYPVGTEITFVIGENDSLIGNKIESIVCTLQSGESKKANIIADDISVAKQPCTDSETVSTPTVCKDKSNSVVLVTITLNSFKNRPEIHYLSQEQKYEIAVNHKMKGVELFKEKQFENAFNRFSKALKYLIVMLPVSQMPDVSTQSFNQLRVQCYANIAACQMKTMQFDFVVANCSKALKIDPDNVKCVYRRAEAYFQSGKYGECRTDVKKGQHLEPKSCVFQQLNKKLEGK